MRTFSKVYCNASLKVGRVGPGCGSARVAEALVNRVGESNLARISGGRSAVVYINSHSDPTREEMLLLGH